MKYLLSIILLTTICFSCTNEKKSSNQNFGKFLNENALESQVFELNPSLDNTLITKNGTYIQIEKGSLVTTEEKVKVEIKEAITMEEIVLAGLTTQTDGLALSSGGMIFINTLGNTKTKFSKAIKIFIPTEKLNTSMQIYKGRKMSDSTINWESPTPLTKNILLNHGEQLFISNCQACHSITDDKTGPALWNVQNRRSKEWLYAFTRNSSKCIAEKTRSEKVNKGFTMGRRKASDSAENEFVISSHDTIKYETSSDVSDYYANCIYNHWNKTAMPGFPNFTDKDLADLYTYIKIESSKYPELETRFKANCCDSCETYISTVNGLEKKRQELINDNNIFFSIKMSPPIFPNSIILQSNNNESNSVRQTRNTIQETKKSVVNVETKSDYYEFSITTTGWYNVDILMKGQTEIVLSMLNVKITNTIKTDLNTILIIPSYKALIRGGKLSDGTSYGFDKNDGSIPLPIGAKCIVVAFAESNSKLILSSSTFIAAQTQTIDLTMKETEIGDLNTFIKSLNLNDMNFEIKDSKNANEIREADKKLRDIEKMKPKNCDCDFYTSSSWTELSATTDFN